MEKNPLFCRLLLFPSDNPMSFGFAHSYELLMSDAMIEVRAFKEHTAAARWLEVAVKTGGMSLVK